MPQKDEILSFTTIWVNLNHIMLSERREKQILYDFIYVEKRQKIINEQKNKINEQMKLKQNKHANTKNRAMVTRGEGGGEMSKRNKRYGDG